MYLIDWGDAVVSHPFCSMGVTLDRLAESPPFWIRRLIGKRCELIEEAVPLQVLK